MGTTQTEQILNCIRAAGPEGAPNYKLSGIALQYNFHIHKLRKDGLDIRKRRAPDVRPGQKSQTFYYYLVGKTDWAGPNSVKVYEHNTPVRPAKIDDLEPLKPEQHTTIGTYLYKGSNYSATGPQKGQTYDLTIGKLEVGKPVRVIAPFERSYADISHFNKDWGIPK